MGVSPIMISLMELAERRYVAIIADNYQPLIFEALETVYYLQSILLQHQYLALSQQYFHCQI